MNKKLLKKAQELAKRPYSVILSHEELSDGSIVYLARNPEIRGCKAQGDNPKEAIANLLDARIDNIYFLLEDEREVPEPASQQTITGAREASISILATLDSSSNVFEDVAEWEDNQENIFSEFVTH